MAVRIRQDGRIVCAAEHEAEEGDVYLDDRAHYRLKVEMGVLQTDDEGETWVFRGAAPIPMILHCPACHLQHIDEPDERTPDWTNPPHRSHLCHDCGHIWRPADVPTNGVRAIATAGKADSPRVSPSTPYRRALTGEAEPEGEAGSRCSHTGVGLPGCDVCDLRGRVRPIPADDDELPETLPSHAEMLAELRWEERTDGGERWAMDIDTRLPVVQEQSRDRWSAQGPDGRWDTFERAVIAAYRFHVLGEETP